MSDAADFQHAFGDALFGAPMLVADPAPARALAVHRNTSAKAAQDALADNFPVVRALVGAQAFAGAATDFVEQAPPVDPRLCLYGAGFPAFFSQYTPFAEYSYLADVGTIEWLAIEALFAADAASLDGAAFDADLDLDRPLRLHPATRHARLSSPAGSIWLAHQADDADASLADLVWVGEAILVTRPADALIVTIFPSGGAAFLDACRAGQSLGAAAAGCGDHLPAIFATLTAAGAFA
uniref:HvfC/BufC N-terminal domain-containing protein n=1 Tax=Sphingomonas sp. TaxID=28214 RepID=UPI0025EC7306|nr:DNA-binding domain-containing protein [Sphingomonas sp.]